VDEGREFWIIGTAVWNEWQSKDRLVSGTCQLAEEDKCSVSA